MLIPTCRIELGRTVKSSDPVLIRSTGCSQPCHWGCWAVGRPRRSRCHRLERREGTSSVGTCRHIVRVGIWCCRYIVRLPFLHNTHHCDIKLCCLVKFVCEITFNVTFTDLLIISR